MEINYTITDNGLTTGYIVAFEGHAIVTAPSSMCGPAARKFKDYCDGLPRPISLSAACEALAACGWVEGEPVEGVRIFTLPQPQPSGKNAIERGVAPAGSVTVVAETVTVATPTVEFSAEVGDEPEAVPADAPKKGK